MLIAALTVMCRCVNTCNMAGLTSAQAEVQLAAYLAAEAAVLSGQSYAINGRTVTRANLAEIQQGIQLWDYRAKALSRGGMTVKGVTPIG